MGLGDCREHAKIWSCRACGCARCDHHSLFYAWSTHPTMAVTGSQCMASTVADGMMQIPATNRRQCLHHPMGEMTVMIDYESMITASAQICWTGAASWGRSVLSRDGADDAPCPIMRAGWIVLPGWPGSTSPCSSHLPILMRLLRACSLSRWDRERTAIPVH